MVRSPPTSHRNAFRSRAAILAAQRAAPTPATPVDFFALLPPELIPCIVEASNHPLPTYVQLLRLSHAIREVVRGTPRELFFNDIIEIPTADALAALIGPCKGLAELWFCSEGSPLSPNVSGCGCTEAACAGWVDEAFSGHDQLAVLEYLPTCSECVIERILCHLPSLAYLRLGPSTPIRTHLLAAIARCCPHLQSLRIDTAFRNDADFTALAPLAGSLEQFRFDSIRPPTNLAAFVSSLSAVDTLHLSHCSPAALEPLADHLTRLRLQLGAFGVAREDLPGPWFTQLERLTLEGCPPSWAALGRLLAPNRATLQRLKLAIDRPPDADTGLVPFLASLDALPLLTHLKLVFRGLPPGADIVTTLPSGLFGRLDHLTLDLVARAEPTAIPPRPIRIASAPLQYLHLPEMNSSALILECPTLVELHLAEEGSPGPLTLKCPQLRLIRNLPEQLDGSSLPMPGLVSASASTQFHDPVWLPDLLAGSPQLWQITEVVITQPDLLTMLGASASLVDIHMDLELTQMPNPLVLRPFGQLKTLQLLVTFHDTVGSFDLRVEAPGLCTLGVECMEAGLTLNCRLGCPALTRLDLVLEGGLASLELPDEGAQLRRLTVAAGTCPPASLLGLLARHGSRLRYVDLFLDDVWPQPVVAALDGLPQLTTLRLAISKAPSPLSLACPHLRTLKFSGTRGVADREHRVVLACPLLETLEGLRDPGRQLELAVPAPNMPPPELMR
ncbi:hypothetical protein PAPYR_2535 [Paratrimastix pyriformis]|uniref:Uncharacterized protein n=1 Tax=Paratrimastix pyriformis TaxID=342808 RepID=A0ABQ8UU63_9EUKA|nr:hypothetical protein PAPYR_2535 [Paratrimastix pyriformis]